MSFKPYAENCHRHSGANLLQADAHLGVYPAELADVREMMASSQDGHVLGLVVHTPLQKCAEVYGIFAIILTYNI